MRCKWCIVLLWGVWLIGCTDSRQAGGVTDIGNSMTVTVRDSAGTAYGHARIQLRHELSGEVRWAQGDLQGQATFRSLELGAWSVLCESQEGERAYLERVSLSDSSQEQLAVKLATRQLLRGRLVGFPAGAQVHVLGLNRLAQLDSVGEYTMEKVPQGSYTLCGIAQTDTLCHTVQTQGSRDTLDVPDLEAVEGALEVKTYQAEDWPAHYLNRDFGGVVSLSAATIPPLRQRMVELNWEEPLGDSLQDFPIALRVTLDSLERIAFRDGFSVRDSTTQALSYEIEFADWEQGSLLLWVRIPLVRAGQTAVRLWLLEGAQPMQSTVFSADLGYLGVYHFGETELDANATVTDASGLGHTGTMLRKAAGRDGQLGLGLLFMGDSQRVELGRWNPFGERFTVSLWVKWRGPSLSHQILVAKRDAWEPGMSHWQWHYDFLNDSIGVYSIGSTEARFSRAEISIDQWVHLAVRYENGNVQMFLNGETVGAARASRLGNAVDAALRLGGDEAEETWQGALDEVRFEGVARSAAWLRFAYLTQK